MNSVPVKEKSQSMFALTKVWFGFLLFAVTINLVPYLPFWDEAAAEQELIVKFEHSSFCAPQSWLETYPERIQDMNTEFIAAAIPLNFKKASDRSSCILPVIPLFTNSRETLKTYGPQMANVSRQTLHLDAHPERGPPGA